VIATGRSARFGKLWSASAILLLLNGSDNFETQGASRKSPPPIFNRIPRKTIGQKGESRMTRSKFFPLVCMLALVLLAACSPAVAATGVLQEAQPTEGVKVVATPSPAPTDTPAVTFPTGRFVLTTDSNYEVVYRDDHTWSYYTGGLMSAKGTYRVDGNLWIEEGTQECPFSGTYEWTFDGKSLSFKLQGEDACDPRREATDGQTFSIK
jgi:hypothetical protein